MGLIAYAFHVVQPDGPRSCPKVSNGCGFKGLSAVQLSAHHAGTSQAPVVITDGAPGALVQDLHSPGAALVPVCQAQLSAV